MRWFAAPGVSPAAKLAALAMVAVLLPVTVLSVLQYRSLVELEAKTKNAAEANLRRSAQAAVRQIEDKVINLAADSLSPLSAGHLRPENLEEAGRLFSKARQVHPEIVELYVISFCACGPEPVAVVSEAGGARRVACGDFPKRGLKGALQRFLGSRRLPDAGTNLTFLQDARRLYAFRKLPGEDTFAALALEPEALARQTLPPAAGGALGFAVRGEGKREIYRTGPAYYEVSAGMGPLLPLWELAAGYQDTTIAALARGQFLKNLLITALVLCCLGAGIFLTLRAASREARLAQLKSDFVSNVSHEMKTPLALIRMFAETLELGRAATPEKVREYHRVIHSESRRLTQLIDNILDFAKMEAGRKEYRFAEGDAGELVEDVVKSYEDHIVGAGFALSVEVARALPRLPLDRDALSQAVLNLLSNAVKYSGEVKRIAVRVGRRGDGVAIEVADSGIGIPKSEHGRIFEKFYRVSSGLVQETKGSGLGLSLARHVVEAHGGRIEVESAPGRGSRFTIALPGGRAAEEPRLGVDHVAETADRRG